ncbi:MAG: glucan biosynthesis protein [Candidatus Contendobacter sp.]|jgi:glucans biosynthesis protein|nr:glucan biosynthesis protein [Candidatus Contendobacter sp.]
MKRDLTRRSFLTRALLLPWLPVLGQRARADGEGLAGLEFGPAQPFSFDGLRQQAQRLAAQPYQTPPLRHTDLLDRIDYDAHLEIRYRPEAALWRRGDGPYPVRFFHLGRLFPLPVKIHIVQAGTAREVLYSSRLFNFGKADFAAALPDDLGFAGFRILHSPTEERDWLAFLGASYFRSAGELDQYGISARGIAIDTALPTAEEFPRFTQFWLEPTADSQAVLIHALLEGPSLTGAYRIRAIRQERVILDIEAVLFFRAPVNRLGVAPLTSMFWFSETNHPPTWDWRPEVHDSDGLALWTGAGERIWRPLNNPPFVQTSSFVDRNPRGFGLSQRDRQFENYQDDRVFYERRPTLWVEPLEPWGEGAVQLIEIPTDYEMNDNIVAYWVPQASVQAGTTQTFRYRLHWVADEPAGPSLGRVIATRLGWNVIPKTPLRPVYKAWFAIDFAGGPLEHLDARAPVQLVVSAKRGSLRSPSAFQVVGTRRWRGNVEFELEGGEPVDLRAYLRLGDRALSETWLYPFIPRPASY